MSRKRSICHAPGVESFARRVDATAWDRVVAELVESWSRSVIGSADPSGFLAGVLTRQWLCKLWSRSRDVVVSTLDKRSTDMRFACPLLQWLETRQEVQQYFEPVCETQEPAAALTLQQ